MAVFQRKLILITVTLSAAFAQLAFCDATEAISTVSLRDIATTPAETATATVVSLEEATISSQLTALVKTMHYQVGHDVKQGDTLVSLDCTDYQLAEDIARARKESAQASLQLALSQRNRSDQLLSQKLTSQQDADDLEAAYIKAAADSRLAQATIERAALDVSRCEVKAPFSGIITERYANTGQLATPGAALYRLLSPQHLEVKADVSEQKSTEISGETEVLFEGLEAYPLRLSRKVKAIDQSTRTQEFRFVFTGEQPLPGTAGKIKWRTSTPHLPSSFIVIYQGTPGFFSAENGAARFHALPDAFPGKAQPVELPLETPILKPPLGDIEDGASITLVEPKDRP